MEPARPSRSASASNGRGARQSCSLLPPACLLCQAVQTLRARRALTPVALLMALTSLPSTASAFPPYRSTDAETADPWTLEARLGLVRVERDGDRNEYASPLLRLNLGLSRNVELVSEFEYRPDEGQVGDAALGFKWVPFMSTLSLGVETLALLPVSRDGGAGVESLLLATWRERALRVHVNAGGFYDDRPADAESGWKVGAIVEMRLDRVRPGVEVFAKQEGGEPAQVLLGPGVIVDYDAQDRVVGIEILHVRKERPDINLGHLELESV